METPQQKQTRARKSLIERRVLIATVAVLFLGAAVVFWILDAQWSNVLSIVFIFMSVLIGLLQWLFPVNSSSSTEAPPTRPAASSAPSTLSGQPSHVILQVSPSAVTSLLTPTVTSVLPPLKDEKAAYRGIMGMPPPTDPRTIQQREVAVRDIYTALLQPTTSAVVLTGIGGVGKSTLAALVYRDAEAQRQAGQGPFTEPATWLNIDPAVTMADLAGNLCEIFARPIPDFGALSLQHQALALFNILNSPDQRRLLVLDQFENLLDWQTGHALANRPGVGEWLGALNSQPCRSRILMTTRPWPLGAREYPPTCMQEYTVKGLEPGEGIELLRKLGVKADESDLRNVVERCGGHAFALTLLAALLHNRKLTLPAFFSDQSYEHVWTGNVARNLLDNIYTSQLNDIQRNLLLGFSVYREPAPLPAARALCDFAETPTDDQIQQALDGLLAQHLLQPIGDGSYQLHAIVEDYARDHFVVHDDLANAQALRDAHARAASYYIQLDANNFPSRGQREQLSDFNSLTEAAWQFCQAHRWRDAHNLIEREHFYADLKAMGGLMTVLELYKLLLPLKQWQATPLEGARVYNYLGSIYRTLGRKELALQYLEQASVLCQEVGEKVEEGWTLNHLGRLYASNGEKERARAYYEEALERARAGGERILEGAALNNLGWIYNAWGNVELERRYYAEALKVTREVGDRWGEAAALNNLARAAEDSGQYEQARQLYQEGLNIFQSLNNLRGCGWSLNNLGRASYFLAHDQAKAREYLEQALEIRRKADRKGEARTLNNLGAVAMSDGDYSLAWKYEIEALAITEEIADLEGRGKVLRNLGLLFLAQKHYPAALAFLLRARVIFDEAQSAGCEKLQEYVDELHQALGDEEFFTLLTDIEPRAEILVAQALKEVATKANLI
jgi:tetratricopeptide (TPR) repeat protein